MNTLQDRLAIPVPKMLRSRPRDTRGYPIPFVVLIDEQRRPQFTINDIRKLDDARRKKLCGLCGRRMGQDQWFIGGVRNFILEHGAFLDPPNHFECAEYALKVCPYLAAPNYIKRLDLQMAGLVLREASKPILVVEHLNAAERPECFGLGHAGAWEWIADPGVYHILELEYLEFWRDGATINAPEIPL